MGIMKEQNAAVVAGLCLAGWIWGVVGPAVAWAEGPEVTVGLEMRTDGGAWQAIAPGVHSVSGGLAEFRATVVPAGSGLPVLGGNPVAVALPPGGGQVQVTLAASGDLQSWSPVAPVNRPLDPKEFYRVEADLYNGTPEGFALIPSGTFIMGSPTDELGRWDDEDQHQVTLTRNFYLQRTEVTWAQWNAVRTWALTHGYTDLPTGRNGYNGDASGQHPVTEVIWYAVLKWLNARSEMENLTPVYTVGGEVYRTGNHVPDWNMDADGYRLPTESEWEYACRAGTSTAFYTGEITTETGNDPNLAIAGWFNSNSGNNTHPVGQKQPNAWGLYDMHGNVWEWCWDYYGPYPSGPVVDPTGATEVAGRVTRGGHFGSTPGYARAAYRNFFWPTFVRNDVGFRPARNAPN